MSVGEIAINTHNYKSIKKRLTIKSFGAEMI